MDCVKPSRQITQHFHMKCLRIILSIRKSGKTLVPGTWVIQKSSHEQASLDFTLLRKAQVRWAGHVTRVPDDRLPNSSCRSMVSSATANDQVVGKRNTSMTSMPPTGKPVPRIDPSGPVSFKPEEEQLGKKQDRGGSEKACSSQYKSDNLLYCWSALQPA